MSLRGGEQIEDSEFSITSEWATYVNGAFINIIHDLVMIQWGAQQKALGTRGVWIVCARRLWDVCLGGCTTGASSPNPARLTSCKFCHSQSTIQRLPKKAKTGIYQFEVANWCCSNSEIRVTDKETWSSKFLVGSKAKFSKAKQSKQVKIQQRKAQQSKKQS